MIAALDYHQDIPAEVLASDIPGIVGEILEPADAEPLALADGMVHQAFMTANDDAVGGFDIARLSRQITLEKVLELPLADKADTGAVFLVVGNQARFQCQ